MSDQYEELIREASELLNKSTNLNTLFCEFTKEILTLPAPDTPTQAKVDALFKDVNKQIDLYNEQYQILKQELGILCRPAIQTDIPKKFFSALVELFRLAYTTFQHYPTELHDFQVEFQSVVELLRDGKFQLQGEPYQKALLLQLTKSAWATTKKFSDQTMDQMVTQLRTQMKHTQGGKRNKTRKQKH